MINNSYSMGRLCHKLVIVAVALIFGAGCDRTMSNRLFEIESFIQEYPDSALSALREINDADLTHRRDRALFSLLMAMSLDKNCIDTADIGVIKPAVSYYSHHKSGDYYSAAMFYCGRIYYNGGDYSNAIICFQEALESTDSQYWNSMILSHMGYAYNKCFNNEEELACSKMAFEIVKESNDSLAIRQAMSALATAYQNNREFGLADSLLSSLCSGGNPYYIAFPQWADLKIKMPSPDYHSIVTMFETGLNNDVDMSVEYWCEYAYALYKCGDRTRSFEIIDQLTKFEDNLYTCIWMGRLAEEEKDFKTALEYETRYEALADSLVRKQLSQSIFKAQTAHYKIVSELERQKRRQYSLMAVVAFLVFLIVASIIMVVYRRRHRKLVENIESLERVADESESMLRLARENLSEVKSNLDSTESKLCELRRSYAKTYQSQFAEIGRMLDYCRTETSVSREAVMSYKERVGQIIKEICQGSKLQGQFEDRINRDLDNIMVKLRCDFPEFKESDFRFLSYVIVGFDATTRSIILNETVNNMRVKKARLIKKIRGSNSKNKHLYGCFLFPEK